MDEFLSKLDIPKNAKYELLGLFTEKRVQSGGVLFDHNDLADTLYYVKEGRLAVYKFTGFLEKMQVIALLDSGAVAGEAALLEGHLRKTRVMAIRDCTLACLARSDFESYCSKFPDSAVVFVKYLLSIVTLRLEKTSERLAHIL